MFLERFCTAHSWGYQMSVQQADVALQDGYELFRRAIVERDEDAWAAIIVRYRRLLIAWAGQCSARVRIAEEGDDIADQAVARAWRALSAAQFASFPTLAALLAYLRTCVAAVVIDLNRSQAVYERAKQSVVLDDVATPEEIILEQWQHADLWRCVEAVIATPQERTVLTESFVYDLPPRAIHARHPALFADVTAVYNVKRNLIGRLQRNSLIQELRAELHLA
jgi:DNA-directed RNA polymerase specialized sigma24 family protein